MKIFFAGICCALSVGVFAQATVTRSYPVQDGQPVTLKFDYPVVKISTWEKNEVSVTAHVNINRHENDSAFVLEEETSQGGIMISDCIKDIESLPRRYTVVYADGKKVTFRSKSEYIDAAKGGSIKQTYEGQDIDIVVEVKVPAHSATNVKAVYGIVEMTDFNAPVTINATYGGIDATLATAHTGKIKATTSYGQIYTNLDLRISEHTKRDFFNSITAEPGTGPAYDFTSTYGKIYLRKP